VADWRFLDGFQASSGVGMWLVAWGFLVLGVRLRSQVALLLSLSLGRTIGRASRRSFSLVGLLFMFGSAQPVAAIGRSLSIRPASAAFGPSRAWAGEPPPPRSPVHGTGPSSSRFIHADPAVHPAVHGSTSVRHLGGPLFVREGRGKQVRVVRERPPRGTWSKGGRSQDGGDQPGEGLERKKSSHPSHPTGDQPRSPSIYEVKPGDSLWGIAEETLRTKDPRRIARYWPRLHRFNREVIGANPNFLQPGQLLRLPPERR
jgi:nucleoid-associated protein YgaU